MEENTKKKQQRSLAEIEKILSLVSPADIEVVEAAGRCLKVMYESRLLPFKEHMDLIIKLIYSGRENMIRLARTLIGDNVDRLLDIVEDRGEVDTGEVVNKAVSILTFFIDVEDDVQDTVVEVDICRIRCHLRNGSMQLKLLQRQFITLARNFLKVEACKSYLLSLKVLKLVAKTLPYDNSDLRIAACICLRVVSGTMKTMAILLRNKAFVIPLIHPLMAVSTSQVVALKAVINDFESCTKRMSTMIRNGDVTISEFERCTRRMSRDVTYFSHLLDDCECRLSAMSSLKNLVLLTKHKHRDRMFKTLTPSRLSSLICDPDPSVQDEALCLTRCLVDGCIVCVERAFVEDGTILLAVSNQLNSSRSDLCCKAMQVLISLTNGNEDHKQAVLEQVLPFLIKFLKSSDDRLRTVTVESVVKLTLNSSDDTLRGTRLIKLHEAGVCSEIQNMKNDSCPKVKVLVKTARRQMRILEKF